MIQETPRETNNETEHLARAMSSHQSMIEENMNPTLRMRSITINGEIREETAGSVTRALLALEVEDSTSPIVMFINTYGGSVYEAFAIYDVMKACTCPIITVGYGKIMSAGTLLVSAGDPGNRYALPNTFFMLHDIQCGSIGSFLDADAQHEHVKILRKTYMDLLCSNTKISKDELLALIPAEKYFTAAKAKALGLIDSVSIKKPTKFFGE